MLRKIPVTLGAVALIVAAGANEAHSAKMPRSVLGGGGAPAAGSTGGGRRMVGTTAQGAIGVSNGGARRWSHGYWRTGAAPVTDVTLDPTPGEATGPLSFSAPWPNPARGQVSFRLELPMAASVGLSVMDVQGRIVDRMEANEMPAGRHTLEWNAQAEGSRAGVYFAKLDVDGHVAGVRRVLILE